MTMRNNTGQFTNTNILLIMASFVIVVAGMRAAVSILVPILLAAFIAVVSAPPLFWLKRRGVPTALALLIVISGVLAVGFGMAAMVGTSLDDFSRDLPVYQERVQEKASALISWLGKMGVDLSDVRILDTFNPGAAMKLVARMLSGLGGVLTNGFLILLTVVFILLEASSFPSKLKVTLKDPQKSFRYFETFLSNVQRYMAIKTVISLGTGIIIALWLAIIGVDYPMLWGLLAFLLNYVPNIGSILAAVPAVLLALIQLGGGSALLAAAGYVVVNVVFGNVIEPKVMGRGLGLSTLVVFLSLVFWGWVFGPVGMLLSVPLTMTLKIALDSHEETRGIAVLLGSEVAAVSDETTLSKESDKQEP